MSSVYECFLLFVCVCYAPLSLLCVVLVVLLFAICFLSIPLLFSFLVIYMCMSVCMFLFFRLLMFRVTSYLCYRCSASLFCLLFIVCGLVSFYWYLYFCFPDAIYVWVPPYCYVPCVFFVCAIVCSLSLFTPILTCIVIFRVDVLAWSYLFVLYSV